MSRRLSPAATTNRDHHNAPQSNPGSRVGLCSGVRRPWPWLGKQPLIDNADLSANPNAAETWAPAGLDFLVADAGAPPRISIRVRPPEERNIKQILLHRHGGSGCLDGSECQSRARAHRNPDQAANDAELTNAHPRPPFLCNPSCKLITFCST